MARMTYQDWKKTPYAGSDAKDPDRSIANLLDKYQIRQRQWTEDIGPNHRSRVTLQFIVGGKTYRVGLEVMDVANAKPEELIKQIKRVIFWTLKPLLENAVVFGDQGRERLLLPFIVDASGHTVYEQMLPYLKDFSATPLLASNVAKRMVAELPPPTE